VSGKGSEKWEIELVTGPGHVVVEWEVADEDPEVESLLLPVERYSGWDSLHLGVGGVRGGVWDRRSGLRSRSATGDGGCWDRIGRGVARNGVSPGNGGRGRGVGRGNELGWALC
jgi:hypothetical protein